MARAVTKWMFTFLIFFSFLSEAKAATFELPEDESFVIGRLQRHQVTQGETFAMIAKRYDVGFLGLMAANRGIDPLLPPDGEILRIPSHFILPDAPRRGIVVNLAELRLYYFDPDGEHVHVFPVGIGRIGRETPQMITSVSQKIDAPTWTPPRSIRMAYKEKGIDLPAVVPAGPDNPLGDYALRLAYGRGEYLIHGTNKDFGIGLRVSSGCIRMEPTNIEWLFQRIDRGTRVQIVNQPIKVAFEPDNSVYIESHEPLTAKSGHKQSFEWPLELQVWLGRYQDASPRVNSVIQVQSGLPTLVGSTD